MLPFPSLDELLGYQPVLLVHHDHVGCARHARVIGPDDHLGDLPGSSRETAAAGREVPGGGHEHLVPEYPPVLDPGEVDIGTAGGLVGGPAEGPVTLGDGVGK